MTQLPQGSPTLPGNVKACNAHVPRSGFHKYPQVADPDVAKNWESDTNVKNING